MGNMVSNAANWSFLQEPMWRWVVFLIAIGFLMSAWARILDHLSKAI